MKNHEYCHYNEQQVRESGLLTPERMAEVSAAITARIEPCFDRAGREIKDALIGDLGEGGRTLFPKVDNQHTMEYVRRTVMACVLTEQELKLINDRCIEAGSAIKNAERFAKAQKVESWDGGVFHGDDYFASIEEMIDSLERNEEDWPEYVWAAESIRIVDDLRVGQVVENDIDDRGWEDMDLNDFSGVTELQAALDKFVAANEDVVSYRPDYSKAVILAPYKNGVTAKK